MTNWGQSILPDDVLYEFDGPCIFSKKYGPFSAFFLKIDESPRSNFFIASFIKDRKLDAIKKGDVSVRSAFMERENIYVIEADFSFSVINSCSFFDSDYTIDVLPESGYALFEHFGRVPDVLPNEDAILSIYFRGDGLSEDHMNLSRFATLTKRTAKFLKKTFLPPRMYDAGNYLNIQIAEPEFGSLMFSVESVDFDEERAGRSPKVRDAIAQFNDELLEERRINFLTDIEKIKGTAASDTGTWSALSDRLNNLHEILPRHTLGLDEVHFVFSEQEGRKRISFNASEASSLTDIQNSIVDHFTRKSGDVVEVNLASQTFLIETALGRQITCDCGSETFDRLMKNNNFSMGSFVTLFGAFTTRPRRDLLKVHDVIEVSAATNSAT